MNPTGRDKVATIRGQSIILAPGSEPAALPHIPYAHEFIVDSTVALLKF